MCTPRKFYTCLVCVCICDGLHAERDPVPPLSLTPPPLRRAQQYELTEQRKADQTAVDSQVIAAISANKEKALICAYLNKPFELTRGMVPHKLKF